MSKKVTLKDIAEATGVTTASVSMILNRKNLSRFTPELVSRVLEAAQELQYVPPSARNKTRQIAVISPSVNNAYHTTIMMGIDRAALASGYVAQIYNTYWNPLTELTILNMLAQQNVAGIIYLMNPLQAERAREIDRSIPIVAIGDIVNELGIDTVDVNNFQAGEMVAEYLIGLGHKHIAYLTTSLNAHHISRVRRCDGLQAAYRRLCPEGSVTVYCKDNGYEQEIQSVTIEMDSGPAENLPMNVSRTRRLPALSPSMTWWATACWTAYWRRAFGCRRTTACAVLTMCFRPASVGWI